MRFGPVIVVFILSTILIIGLLCLCPNHSTFNSSNIPDEAMISPQVVPETAIKNSIETKRLKFCPLRVDINNPDKNLSSRQPVFIVSSLVSAALIIFGMSRFLIVKGQKPTTFLSRISTHRYYSLLIISFIVVGVFLLLLQFRKTTIPAKLFASSLSSWIEYTLITLSIIAGYFLSNYFFPATTTDPALVQAAVVGLTRYLLEHYRQQVADLSGTVYDLPVPLVGVEFLNLAAPVNISVLFRHFFDNATFSRLTRSQLVQLEDWIRHTFIPHIRNAHLQLTRSAQGQQ